MKNLLVSVSGGRSSAVMAHHIATSEKYSEYNKLYVFANTGREREETLVFIDQMSKNFGIKIHWIEAEPFSKEKFKIVDFVSACRIGKPFRSVIGFANKNVRTGLPNQGTPYCSSRLKSEPIHKFAKTIFGKKYITAIGFRYEDMPKRISWAEIKEEKSRIFPLITDFDLPLTQKDVHNRLIEIGIDLGIASSLGNCDLCWKKSDKKLIEAIVHGVDVDFWRELENQYNDRFFRGNRSVDDLVKLSKLPNTEHIDFENPCICSV